MGVNTADLIIIETENCFLPIMREKMLIGFI